MEIGKLALVPFLAGAIGIAGCGEAGMGDEELDTNESELVGEDDPQSPGTFELLDEGAAVDTAGEGIEGDDPLRVEDEAER